MIPMTDNLYPCKFSRKVASLLLIIIFPTFLGGCGEGPAPQEMWGRTEATEVDLTSKIPGRVVNLLVKEGDHVEKGQLLALIDSRDLKTQANQAQANINALQAQTVQASTVTHLQNQTTKAALNTAKAQLEQAGSDLELAKSDYNRFKELVAAGAVSKQLFDTYRTKYQVAQAAYAQASAGVNAAEAELLQTDVNRANEAAMQSKVDQARASLQQVEVNLDETEIRAPFAGIITTKYVEEGAMVSTGMPIVTIQDPTDNWVNFKVQETELSRYHLQQTVGIVGRDGSLELQGIIVDISKKPEFATQRATNERKENDIITFNVKVQVNSETIRPGMRFRLMNGGA